MTKIRKKAISEYISIDGKRICEILMIIPFFIFTSCGSKCDDIYDDYDGVEVPKETCLRVYEIKSDIVRRIIKEKIIPYATTKVDKTYSFFYISQDVETDTKVLTIGVDDFDMGNSISCKTVGWFEMDGFQFVVNKSAKEYFAPKFRWHRFNYVFYICPYDPPFAYYRLDNNSYTETYSLVN